MNIRWPGMRYTKAALAVFGAGLVLGFVVVVLGGHPRLERTASALMALGLVALPVGLFADGRGMTLIAWIAARLRGARVGKPAAKRRSATPRRKPPAKAAVKPASKPPAKPRAKPKPRTTRRKRR